jgi:hypothetical protein
VRIMVERYREPGEFVQEDRSPWLRQTSSAFILDQGVPCLKPPKGRHNPRITLNPPQRERRSGMNLLQRPSDCDRGIYDKGN